MLYKWFSEKKHAQSFLNGQLRISSRVNFAGSNYPPQEKNPDTRDDESERGFVCKDGDDGSNIHTMRPLSWDICASYSKEIKPKGAEKILIEFSGEILTAQLKKYFEEPILVEFKDDQLLMNGLDQKLASKQIKEIKRTLRIEPNFNCKAQCKVQSGLMVYVDLSQMRCDDYHGLSFGKNKAFASEKEVRICIEVHMTSGGGDFHRIPFALWKYLWLDLPAPLTGKVLKPIFVI